MVEETRMIALAGFTAQATRTETTQAKQMKGFEGNKPRGNINLSITQIQISLKLTSSCMHQRKKQLLIYLCETQTNS